MIGFTHKEYRWLMAAEYIIFAMCVNRTPEFSVSGYIIVYIWDGKSHFPPTKNKIIIQE